MSNNAAGSYASQYLGEVAQIVRTFTAAQVDDRVESMVQMLVALRERQGRLFILGVGGGAGNATHAVNDFRKLAGIEAYSPTDNVSELTARTNDEGWETTFVSWLRGSHLNARDMLLVFSVGGGSLAHNISANLVRAVEYARQVGAGICGIVGRDGGYTAQVADVCIIVPTVNTRTVTGHTESFQALFLHLLVSHPALQIMETKWGSVR